MYIYIIIYIDRYISSSIRTLILTPLVHVIYTYRNFSASDQVQPGYMTCCSSICAYQKPRSRIPDRRMVDVQWKILLKRMIIWMIWDDLGLPQFGHLHIILCNCLEKCGILHDVPPCSTSKSYKCPVHPGETQLEMVQTRNIK